MATHSSILAWRIPWTEQPGMQETQETWVPSQGQEDPLEEGMATHSSILAWRIPWTEEPGGLQSVEVQRVSNDWATFTFTILKLGNFTLEIWISGFPDSSAGKESACNAGATGDTGSVPGLGRSPGAGHGNTLQYSCLKNPMDRGAWWATVHMVAQSRTQLK